MTRIIQVLAQASLIAFAIWISVPARADGSAFPIAAAQFAALPVATRYEIQMLLIASGYSQAVSNETFSTRAFDSITQFQAENGFTANGILTSEQLAKLKLLSDPILSTWDLSVVRHPANNFPLWVPSGLGLQKKTSKTGLILSTTDNSVFISFDTFDASSISAAHSTMLSFLNKENLSVTYDVARSNFFVISAVRSHVQSYMRFERRASEIIGFWLMWRPDAPVYGTRLSALMSDLFRSAASGIYRSPPEPDVKLSVARQPTEDKSSSSRPSSGDDEKGPSSGSGFFVSKDGNLLTNAHVVNGCTTITVSQQGGVPSPARLMAKDVTNDLALIRTSLVPKGVPAFRAGVRVGESIAAYGFPLNGILATNGNFTMGNVTATAGLQDDSRMLQISAPVQPGNSGGPLLDQYGNVIGIVVSKLNALKVAAVMQDVPQNINFAIKVSVAQTFLETNSVSVPTVVNATHLAPEDIADKAKDFTAFIRCDVQ